VLSLAKHDNSRSFKVTDGSVMIASWQAAAEAAAAAVSL